ncbi:MAG: phage/plasmid primase, P4 family [Pseudomonadota bacterium]
MGELHVMPAPDPVELAWYATNDQGNAQRLKARVLGLLRWVDMGADQGYWIAYKDGRWQTQIGAREARLAADDVAECLRLEARALAQQIAEEKLGKDVPKEVAEEQLEILRKWANKSGNAVQSRGMLDKARAVLAVSPDAFDSDPLAFNCRNGTVRFYQDAGAWRVRLDPHDPHDMITRQADVDYDAEAPRPRWERRTENLQPEPDQREFMKRIYGYAMLGIRSAQVFIIAQGKGGDGKSLTHAIFAAMLGDYYRRAGIKSFLKGAQKSGSDHSEDLARLAGDTRLVTASEPPRRSTWDTEIIKDMTGGDKIVVRGLRESSREIRPGWLLVVECNTYPAIETADDGFRRRVEVLQWPVQVPKGSRGDFETIKAELLAERSGVLNWMIEGALAWLESRDLMPSERAMAAKEAYVNAADPFGDWYRARCVTGRSDEFKTKVSDLHEDFARYCRDELDIDEDYVPKIRKFGAMLEERQHRKRKISVWYRLGIRLKTDAELAADCVPSGGGEVESMPGD